MHKTSNRILSFTAATTVLNDASSSTAATTTTAAAAELLDLFVSIFLPSSLAQN